MHMRHFTYLSHSQTCTLEEEKLHGDTMSPDTQECHLVSGVAWVNLMCCIRLHTTVRKCQEATQKYALASALHAGMGCPHAESIAGSREDEMRSERPGSGETSWAGVWGYWVLPWLQVCIVSQTSQSAPDTWQANAIIIYNLDRLRVSKANFNIHSQFENKRKQIKNSIFLRKSLFFPWSYNLPIRAIFTIPIPGYTKPL
jgi:hypothetical protein